jgi:hypothetical protein
LRARRRIAGETAGRGRDDGAWGFEVGRVHFPGMHFGGRARARRPGRRVRGGRAREGTVARLAGEGREGTAAAEVVGREGAAAGQRGRGAWASARARRQPRGQGRGGASARRRRRGKRE